MSERAEGIEVGAGGAPGTAGTIVHYDTDLFFAVKVADTLKHAGYVVLRARTLDDLAARLRPTSGEPPTLALVNTAARGVDWRGAIPAARAAGVPIVAYGAHVDLAWQDEARTLGATGVIANSKLASDLPGVVARAVRRALRDGAEPRPREAADSGDEAASETS